MANAIQMAKLYEPLLQEAYRTGVISGIFEDSNLVSTIRSALANEVYVPKMIMDGLGNYDRTNGYPKGDIAVEWVPFVLQQDRGKKFAVDVVDDMESMKVAGAHAMGQFMAHRVIPEVDAYRFAKWAMGSKAGNRAYGSLSSGSNLVTAIDTAITKMDDAEVPTEGRILLLTPSMYAKLKSAVWEKRMYVDGQDNVGRKIVKFDEMRVIKVPANRFYSGCTLGADGYTNSGTALNFMVIHPSAVFAVTKHNAIKAADPNVDIDAMQFAFRLYHDAFVVPNHEDGIYVHSVNALTTVATPTITVDDDETTSPDFTLASSTAGASIYYTTDGSTPTAESTAYSAKVTLTTAGTYTIKAIAMKDGMNNSAVASETITVSAE